MLRRCSCRHHGLLTFPTGTSRLAVGRDLRAMIPSNSISHDGAKLRKRLDDDGYLYFKGAIERKAISAALEDVGQQMLHCGWTRDEDREAAIAMDGFSVGIPHPTGITLPEPNFTLSNEVKAVTCGSTLMANVRKVFSGAVVALPHFTLDFSHPQEQHGFRMSSVYMNRGTKLALVAWVPLHDTPLHMGGLCVVRGSNSSESYAKIRSTYGSMDVEGSGIAGDGCYTMDAEELLPLGKQRVRDEYGAESLVDVNPIVTTSFEAGDMVLMTVYTMYGYLTNASHNWRVSCESRWMMEGDDIGPDPRYAGTDAPGLSTWLAERDDVAKYPRSMLDAKREWGLT